MPRWVWEVEVRRAYPKVLCCVETEDGPLLKQRSIPVVIRRLWLHAAAEVFGPRCYRVTRTERKGRVIYGIFAQEVPKRPVWPELKLRPDPPLPWKRVGALEQSQLLAWLTDYLGVEAQAAFSALLSSEP